MPGVWCTRGLACRKNTRVSHHRYAETIRHSLRDSLRLIRDLPGVPGLIATVAREFVHELDTSVGVSGPHDFAVRAGIARRATPTRPSHPAPRFVTIGRNVPLAGAGRPESVPLICPTTQVEYFLPGDWTTQISLICFVKLTFVHTHFDVPCGPWEDAASPKIVQVLCEPADG